MRREARERCEQLLSHTACELSLDAGFPISLQKVCSRLNVGVRWRELQHDRALLVKPVHGRELVVLPKALRPGRSHGRARFLLAHELGHLVLRRRGIGEPFGKKEYWVHETLCDLFAYKLLLPDWALSGKLLDETTSLMSHLRFVRHLAMEGKVNWRTAAARIAGFVPNVVFIVLELRDEKYEVRFSTNRKGISRRLDLGVSAGDLDKDGAQVSVDSVEAEFPTPPKPSDVAAGLPDVGGSWKLVQVSIDSAKAAFPTIPRISEVAAEFSEFDGSWRLALRVGAPPSTAA